MLYEDKEYPEIYFMKHYNDDNNHIKYDEMMLKKTLSPYMFENDTMNNYLNRTEKLVGLLVDDINVFKNFKNWCVDKFEYRQL